jgi:hypothetical protein
MMDFISMDGRWFLNATTEREIEGMTSPVRCQCGSIYDLGSVTVLQRYADCSVWKTPCCKRTTDDRPAGWKSGPSYTELRRFRND